MLDWLRGCCLIRNTDKVRFAIAIDRLTYNHRSKNPCDHIGLLFEFRYHNDNKYAYQQLSEPWVQYAPMAHLITMTTAIPKTDFYQFFPITVRKSIIQLIVANLVGGIVISRGFSITVKRA
jgi:hypothetical protein